MEDNQENNSLFVNEDKTSESDTFSCGITSLLKLSVRKIVLFTGGLSVMLLGLVIFFLVGNLDAHKPNRYIPKQVWHKEPVYEMITESFKDTSPKAEDGFRREGQGVGDIKGNLFSVLRLTAMVLD